MLRDYARALAETILGRDRYGLPADLNRVARDLGAVDILYQSRALEGFTDFKPRGPVIYLAVSRSDGRRRFTLAHECGHILLASSSCPPPPDDLGELDEELLCDAIAAELLVPTTWLDIHRAELDGLPALLEVATKLRVSMAMLVNRLRTVNAHHALLRVRPAPDGEWLIMERSGMPRSWHGEVAIGPGSQRLLTASAAGHDNVQIELISSNKRLALPAQCFKQRTTALILLGRRRLD
jgi:hypothetical protein